MPFSPLRACRPFLFAGAALATVPALAADPLPPPVADGAPDAAEGEETQDIVVTARRRAERSQDVPIAIAAFGAAQIEATRTYNLRDLQQLLWTHLVPVNSSSLGVDDVSVCELNVQSDEIAFSWYDHAGAVVRVYRRAATNVGEVCVRNHVYDTPDVLCKPTLSANQTLIE